MSVFAYCRGTRIPWTVVLECALVTMTTLACSSEACTVPFRFPSLSSNLEVHYVEGSTVTLPFSLDTSQCQLNMAEPFYIYVFRPPKNDGTRDGFCTIRFTDKGCRPLTGNKCICADEHGNNRFEFNKNVTQADNGVWLWRTGEQAEHIEVRFFIQDTDVRSIPTQPAHHFDVQTASDAKGADHKSITSKTKAFAPDFKTYTTHSPVFGEANTGKSDDKKGPDEVTSSGEKADSSTSNLSPVFVVVNVSAIIAVAIVAFVCWRKRQIRQRDQAKSVAPPPNEAQEEDDIIPVGRRPEPLVGVDINNYELPGRIASRHYDRFPIAVDAQDSDSRIPDYMDIRESGYGYEIVV